MSVSFQEAIEMKVKDEENLKAGEETIQNDEVSSTPAEDSASELSEPLWSIVTFESVAVQGLTYQEALKWLEKLNQQKISGLCIVTDEAASRISN
jgi:hypothetical protein